jgi:two-component system nitrogen regulation sensor histidine kinase NtrY
MNRGSGLKWTGSIPRSGWIVAGLFFLAFLATWGLGNWDGSGSQTESLELNARQERSYTEIQRSLSDAYADLHRLASALAASPDVIKGFRERSYPSGDRSTGAAIPGNGDRLVRILADYDLEERGFVEIYDQSPSLIAWKGPVFPMDPGISSPDFLSVPLDQVAKDGSKRTAIVVWQPIYDGPSVLGAVRMGTVVESYMPIRNDFLRDYSLSEEWSARLGSTVTLAFGERPGDLGDEERPLRSTTGQIVGSMRIDLPDQEFLAAERVKRFDDLQVFWIVLLMVWILLVFSRALWRHFEDGSDLETRPERPRRMMGLVWYLAYVLAFRWVLLVLEAPSRWQLGKSPLAPLFDPQHMGSVFGFGAFRTIGDLFISASLLTLASLMILRTTAWIRQQTAPDLHFNQGSRPSARAVILVLGHALWTALIAAFLFQVSSHTILDSTLDYFARSGLLPEPLVLVVFGALLLLVFSGILIGGRSLWVIARVAKIDLARLPSKATVLVLYSGVGVLVGWLSQISGWGAPAGVYLLLLISMLAAAGTNPFHSARSSPIVALRHVVPVVMTVSILLFPMLEMSADLKTELRMRDAAVSFQEDKDSRVMFAVSQVLDSASHHEFSAEYENVQQYEPSVQRARMDSLAEESTSGFLLSALAGYDVTVTIHNMDGRVLGRYSNLIRRVPRSTRDAADEVDFDLFKAMYLEFGGQGPMVEKLTGISDQNRFRYAGFQHDAEQGPYYVLVRAEQRALTETAGTPFPKVLSPAGYYGDRYADFSVAEFKDGILVRSQGQSFGRSFLEPGVLDRLSKGPETWIEEDIRDRRYQTYYRIDESLSLDSNSTVIAVRRRTTNFFDQLYHLLRVVVAGLFLAAPFYVGGLIWRALRYGKPVESRHFRDRVLNSFFLVGIVTVVAMGFVGMGVVTGENERAIDSWLRQHLDRVEETLQLEARGEELPYRVLDRISIDSLAARVGLDLVIYHGTEVDQASRPELIRDRLIEKRLPIEAYEALYFDGFRFVTVNERLGTFEYKAGYRALTDERGRPHYVVSIPTLPEQERIEEERARTVAYLFGALLLLVLAVMVTASLLANSLSRPIAKLRAGLQSVAAGHFERISKIDSKDEIADLVDSFNTMQEQLEESQRLIGQQERQLAWKEMARQVAHEIKNPLTPMKLSIQHLRSAFLRRDDSTKDQDTFVAKFNRTTMTLIEQIDTLARIANEFSSFGRMPTHIREEVDLNAVVREAVELMQSEENVRISLSLGEGKYIVHADREALRRVYVNFLKNAIQAVPQDRMAEIEVTSETVREGDKNFVLSKVMDNGTGIPRNLWDKIFVPSFSTKTSGTGLGLAIARKTIENMEGEIGFEEESDHGATFWIKVPLSTIED